MAYERDDRWRSGRREAQGYDRDRSDWNRDRDRDRGSGRHHERGFFERAGDEISSWFGDEDAERRRRRDEHMSDRGDERGHYGAERGSRRDHDRSSAYRPMGWTSSNRDYREDYDRGMEGSSRYQPMAGDYGRGAEDEGRPSYGRGGDQEWRSREPRSNWESDSYRRTSFAGSSASSNYRDHPYDEWRRRHMAELDRDYDDYRRESQSRFENDFGHWRERRQEKRGLLGRIREHMEVVGADGEHVGTVDRIAGDRLILTKSDPDAGGHHHSISCTMIDKVDGDKVRLEMDADKAKEQWRNDDRERALFEREDQGEAGPHMLDRSFSGTYR